VIPWTPESYMTREPSLSLARLPVSRKVVPAKIARDSAINDRSLARMLTFRNTPSTSTIIRPPRPFEARKNGAAAMPPHPRRSVARAISVFSRPIGDRKKRNQT